MENQKNKYSEYKTLDIPKFSGAMQAKKDKVQNILILALSTFHYNTTAKRAEASDTKYTVRGKEAAGEYHGTYQLEPVPKYLEKTLQAQSQHLDEIIILCSKKSRDRMEAGHEVVINNEYISGCSPLDYFVCAIDHADEFRGHTPFYYIVKTEDDNERPLLTDAMSSILAEVRRNENACIYVDIHGGMRDAQQIISGLLSLLKIEGRNIEPDNIYSVVIPGNAGSGEIVEAGETLRLYDFISGINELMNYGRIDSLDDYEKNASTTAEEKALIDELRSIAESIQLNNIKGFEEALDRLPTRIEKCRKAGRNSFLNLYLTNIEEHYRPVIGPNRTIPNEIRWSLNHGFYQQVLTLIESRMPDYFFENGWLDFDERAMDKVAEKKRRMSTVEKMHSVFNICVPYPIAPKYRVEPLLKGNENNNLKESKLDHCEIVERGDVRNPLAGYVISVDEPLKETIRLHIAFKALRNNCNHTEMQRFPDISMELFTKRVREYLDFIAALGGDSVSKKSQIHVKAPKSSGWKPAGGQAKSSKAAAVKVNTEITGEVTGYNKDHTNFSVKDCTGQISEKIYIKIRDIVFIAVKKNQLESILPIGTKVKLKYIGQNAENGKDKWQCVGKCR